MACYPLTYADREWIRREGTRLIATAPPTLPPGDLFKPAPHDYLTDPENDA